MKKIISLCMLAFILSGCTSENGNASSELSSEIIITEGNYNFTGSSESWEVQYEVDIIEKGENENQVEENGTAKFIGEGEPPKTVDYKLETESGANSSEGSGIMMNDETLSFAQGSCGNCVPIQEDEELELEIIWDGKSEIVILNSNE
ncbi:hypothetical protein [Metaplanococcus flavidus]|uniref:Lipoprotein n=1 Tax=Metaplanococcus flavidus TaxID=569883 RepID=A0ABW3L8Y3_9BACL